MEPPDWKCMVPTPYEISEEGQVRVQGQTMPLERNLTNGWLCVSMSGQNVPVAVLMDIYWPDVQYPSDWSPE